jgi:hypothetical protein
VLETAIAASRCGIQPVTTPGRIVSSIRYISDGDSGIHISGAD